MAIEPTDVLIVVDVQTDFISGTLAIAGADDIIAPINRLAAQFEHIVLTADWHPEGHISFASAHPGGVAGERAKVSYGEQPLCPDHCVQDTAGAEIDPRLEVTKAELILRKGYRREVDSFGAFYENDGTATRLGAYLKARGFPRVYCVGLARYGCVMQTALGAAQDGFETFIVRDASAGYFDVEANDKRLAAAGVTWTSTDEVLAGEVSVAA